MNKIQDRISYDGSITKLDELKSWYDKDKILSNRIGERLETINLKYKEKRVNSLLQRIKNNVHEILLLPPEKLEEWVKTIESEYSGVFTKHSNKKESTELGKQVLDAFDYNYYRGNRLIDLAKRLNVKCCPYCNMHYTLYAEEGKKKSEHLAKFQFDHFFSKVKYPMLSMSFYNLIPSCSICNQGKSDSDLLSLSFHPYLSDICEQFKFEIDNPIALLRGEKINDYVDVNLVATGCTQSELDNFAKTFHLKALYQRHGDVAQEAFDKAYEYPYYSHTYNFGWLRNVSEDYILRLWMGTYPDEKDIEKRPLTKFCQDLRKQAERAMLSQE